MSTTYRFLAIGDESEVVLDWFRRLPDAPVEIVATKGLWLYFRSFGSLAHKDSSTPGTPEIDISRSPLVHVLVPTIKRGILWTAGEVYFTPKSVAAVCPPLNAVNRRFGKWLSGFDLVYARGGARIGEWDYYLEGNVRNGDANVYALPAAMEALRRGQYFVGCDDNDYVLEKICRALRRRGVEGIAEGSA